MMLSFLELFFETGRIYFIVNRDTDSNPEFVNICRMDVSRSQPVEALFEQTMDFSDVSPRRCPPHPRLRPRLPHWGRGEFVRGRGRGTVSPYENAN